MQDSNGEACSEVAEVPYPLREESTKKNKEERKTIKMFVIFFCVCVFLGEELFYRY